MIEVPHFNKKSICLRDDPFPRLSNDPRSRLYMPPENVVPPLWIVDPNFVKPHFEDDFDGDFVLKSPVPIAQDAALIFICWMTALDIFCGTFLVIKWGKSSILGSLMISWNM